ncbi:hypothetical protein [Paraburkholderia sp.]|uniref:hypothetical protein n=1 Tax=Paraburkholderia sp. TaxID=1926495 RepID=UPI0039E24533
MAKMSSSCYINRVRDLRNEFQSPVPTGVPAIIELGRLLQITERILRDEETDEDLQLIFAPGSSLGGARPKASVIAMTFAPHYGCDGIDDRVQTGDSKHRPEHNTRTVLVLKALP